MTCMPTASRLVSVTCRDRDGLSHFRLARGVTHDDDILGQIFQLQYSLFGTNPAQGRLIVDPEPMRECVGAGLELNYTSTRLGYAVKRLLNCRGLITAARNESFRCWSGKGWEGNFRLVVSSIGEVWKLIASRCPSLLVVYACGLSEKWQRCQKRNGLR